MAENKKIEQPDNGAAGLRSLANAISVIAIFGLAWALVLTFIGTISWSSFLWFCAGCVGAIINRYIFLALATCAEAASRYLSKTKADE